ncbi:type II secretion system protein [bacterium]|nr:MAG: type II secretion system protein [bacterium]
MKKNKAAFTLIEIMVAIAIVAILASVVLVSMKSYGAKGRSTKALAQLSSAIPPMISCWGNGGTITVPPNNSSRDICSLAASYGQWPATSGDLSSYSYGSSVSSKSSWYISFTSGSSDDNKRICCNSTMNSCKVLDTAATACDASNPSY